jgi:DNA polymerase-3 subunit beta
MHFTVNRAAFAEAAAFAAAAISKSPNHPALSGMLIDAGPSAVMLTGYDGDTLHETATSAGVNAEGRVLASGRFLVQIVAAMKGDVVELKLDGSRLVISCGRATYRLQTIPTDQYPGLPSFPKHVGTIASGSLANVLGRAEHALGKNPNLIALTGFRIIGTSGELEVCSTDVYRMARVTAPWADASGSEFSVVVPGLALMGAVKGLAGDVKIGTHEGLFGLSDGTRSVVTRTLDDKYPAVDKVMANQPTVFFEADAAPLVEALKRAVLVNDSDDRTVCVVTFSDGLVQVSADGQTGDGSEEVDVDSGFGEGELPMKFNGSYLAQGLLACSSDRVRFGIMGVDESKRSQPIHVRPVGDDSTLAIVMPRGNV